MPLITIPFSARTGVRVQLRVTINRATLLTLRQNRQPIPQPVIVTAVLDTGAERSCIDPSVASRAALSLYGFGIEAVIGRDVLASCVLVYNGPTASATLAY